MYTCRTVATLVNWLLAESSMVACQVNTARCGGHTHHSTLATTTPWTRFTHSHRSRMRGSMLAVLEETMSHQQMVDGKVTMKATNTPSQKARYRRGSQTSRLTSFSTRHHRLIVLFHLRHQARSRLLRRKRISGMVTHTRQLAMTWMPKASGCLGRLLLSITARHLPSTSHSDPKQTQKSVDYDRPTALRVTRHTTQRRRLVLLPSICHHYPPGDLCPPNSALQISRSAKNPGRSAQYCPGSSLWPNLTRPLSSRNLFSRKPWSTCSPTRYPQ